MTVDIKDTEIVNVRAKKLWAGETNHFMFPNEKKVRDFPEQSLTTPFMEKKGDPKELLHQKKCEEEEKSKLQLRANPSKHHRISRTSIPGSEIWFKSQGFSHLEKKQKIVR